MERIDYSKIKSICPTCKKHATHLAFVEKMKLIHFDTYYCEACQQIHLLAHKNDGERN